MGERSEVTGGATTQRKRERHLTPTSINLKFVGIKRVKEV